MNMFIPNKNSELSSSPEAQYDGIRQEELVSLLRILQQQAESLSNSPRKIVLEHAIQVCQSFLSNLLEIDWHKHLCDQAKFKNRGLDDQLMLVLKLLDSANLMETAASSVAHCTGDVPAYQDEAKVFREAWHSLDEWMKMPSAINAPASIQVPSAAQEKASFRPSRPIINNFESNQSGALEVTFFGTFTVCQDGKVIDCFSKSRAKQLLKYLLLNRTKAIPKEVLMDRFWTGHDENSARNNLNVAVYCLRQALKTENSDLVHVLFQDGCYFLNNQLRVLVDTEAFEQYLKTAEQFESQGKSVEAVEAYKQAEAIYQGEFLAEDLYEDWSLELREYYKSRYVQLLGKLSEYYYRERALDACIAVNRKITSIEIGDEHAHRRLMECFARLNQRHLALRQFQLCSEVLIKEFELRPSKETVALYQYIKAQDLTEQVASKCA